MQLTFLGRPYEASFPVLETSESTETGTFLGQRYAKKQIHVTQRQQPAVERIFLGQRYTR